MRIKQFILIAAVAIAAASCAHSFEAQETQQPAIGFGTWAEQLTKSTVNGNRDFVAGDDFAVYGFNTKSAVNTTIFDDQVVTAQSTEPITWKYTPLRFWDPTTESYTFFAVSPASYGTETTVDPQTGLFTSATVDFSTPDKDVLVASKKVVVQANYGTEVQLSFNHVASLVDVRVKMDASLASSLETNFAPAPVPTNAGLMITSASLVNIQQSGTFTVDHYDGSNENKPVIGSTTYGWVPSASPVVGNYGATVTLPLHVTASTQYSNHVENEDPDVLGQDLYTKPLVLMPQALGDGTQQLHIEYDIITQVTPTIVKTSYSANIDINDFITTDRDDNGTTSSPVYVPAYWAPGTHYIYTLTIGANAIVFTAQINEWAVVNGYRYLLQ